MRKLYKNYIDLILKKEGRPNMNISVKYINLINNNRTKKSVKLKVKDNLQEQEEEETI